MIILDNFINDTEKSQKKSSSGYFIFKCLIRIFVECFRIKFLYFKRSVGNKVAEPVLMKRGM